MSLPERSGLSSTTTKAFLFFQSHVLGRVPAWLCAGCGEARPGSVSAPSLPSQSRAGAGITPQTHNQTLRGGISIPLTQLGAKAGVIHTSSTCH